MSKKENNGVSILRSQIMSAISVCLVLLLMGLTALAGLAARNVAKSVEQQIGMTVVLQDSLDNASINAIGTKIRQVTGVETVEFTSPGDVLHRWNTMMGGSDSILTADAFLPEWDVKMKAESSTPQALAGAAEAIRKIDGVFDVAVQQAIAEEIHSTVDTGTLVFIILASVLGVISFVLISNTVRLAVYARRNTIHAMRLVGATRGFIRRPFVMSALLEGLIAATGASIIIAGGLFYTGTIWPAITETIAWEEAAWVFCGLYVSGALLCTAAALFATNRYLRIDYDRYFN